jgi:hypothetical protein
MAFRPAESTLAWATHEVLNFVRVAKRIDYSPKWYLSGSDTESIDVNFKGIDLPS